MDSSTQIKGLISYLTKLTHTVDAFRVSFGNIEVGKTTRGMQSYAQIKYDLNVTPKQPDSPYLWDFFNCKSKHIIQDGCEMVGLSWAEVFTEVKDIYYNGRLSGKYGGNIPNSFIKKITKDIEQSSPKQINTHFFCGGDKKRLTLENIPKDLVETIVGYVSEDDNLRTPSDNVVWDEITKYMDLADCELWTHTYTYIRNIGDIDVTDFDYVNHSTFSSKMCDFITGDY